MNRSVVLTGVLMLFVTTSVFAAQSNDCASKGAHMKPAERDAFMKSCLAQLSSPANAKEREQQRKKAQCEQNASNQHLQGNEKSNYVASCVNKNEAETAAKAAPATAVAKTTPEKSSHKVAATQNGKPAKQGNHRKSCAQQAKDKGLKGDERKKFLSSCK